MRKTTENQKCICVIGSMTQAMKAQNVLAMAAIRAEVIKADSTKTKQGCAYAVTYPCVQERNVMETFRQAGIRPLFYEKGGGL